MKTIIFIIKRIFYTLLLTLLFLYLLFLFPFPFISGKTKEEFKIKDIGRDTAFQFQKYNHILSPITKSNFSSKGGIPFTITVLGNTDQQTQVYIKYKNYPEKFYPCTLSPGKVDTTLHGELYEDRVEIAYCHYGAKKGNLKIIFRLGNEVMNSL